MAMDDMTISESTAQTPHAIGAAINRTLITGVIGSDTHIVGNRILSMALEKAGFTVIALGALTPSADFIKAAVETAADAILVSSLYGLGELDCRGFHDQCLEAGLDDIAYVSKDQAETSVLFELIAARYERRSLLITANQPFGDWAKVFPDQAMTLAAVDRLVHHATIFEMNVESYRRRTALERKRRPGRPPSRATIKTSS